MAPRRMQRGGAGPTFTVIRSNRAIISGVTPPTGATHFKIDLYCFPPKTTSSVVYDKRLSELTDIYNTANGIYTAAGASATQAQKADVWNADNGVNSYKANWKRSPTPLPTTSTNGIGLVYSKPPTAYTTTANNSTVILCGYTTPAVPLPATVNSYLAVVSSGPTASGPWTAGELIGPVTSPSATQAEIPTDVAACAAEAAAAVAATAPAPAPAAPTPAPSAPSAAPAPAPAPTAAEKAAACALCAAPAAPAAPAATVPKCYGGRPDCKVNGTVPGTVIQRTKAGEPAMCYYTEQECASLNGKFYRTTDLFPKGAPTDLGECLAGGASYTWNCRPGQGGGRRIKRTRKNKKAKKQTRRVRKQRR